MPSTSKSQHNLMAMCSSDSGRAKAHGECPPKSVAREFMRADRGRFCTEKGCGTKKKR